MALESISAKRAVLILILLAGAVHATSWAQTSPPGEPNACIGLTEGFDASKNPELSPSERKAALISERTKAKLESTNKDFTQLTGPGGFFIREYKLESGEILNAVALAEIRGQVLFIRHLVISPVIVKKVFFWHKSVLDLSVRASSSPSEMKQILNTLSAEARSFGISMIVLEGQRITGARSADRPWIQIVIDLNKS